MFGFSSLALPPGGAPAPIGALALLAGEAEGMAIDATIDNRGMVAVKDASTPGNNVTNIPIDEWLNNGTTSPTFARKADGTYGWSKHNLLSRSNDMSNWTNVGTADSGTTLTADAGTGEHIIATPSPTTAANLPLTAQVKFTQGTHRYVTLCARTSGNDYVVAVFDLAGGGSEATETDAGSSSGTVISTSQTPDGAGFICAIAFTIGEANAVVRVGFAEAATGNTFNTSGSVDWQSAAAGTETVEVENAQLNRGSVALDYFPTTTAARFAPALHVDPTHGQGLLVEPQATNLLLYSRDLSNAAWTKSAITVSADDALVGLPGFEVEATGTTGVISQQVSADNVTQYVASWFLKAGTLSTVELRFGLSGNYVGAVVDLAAGTMGSLIVAGTAANENGRIVDLGGGIYFCWLTASGIGNGFAVSHQTYPGTSTTGTGTVFAAQPQAEVGSVPTSPIETAGAQVTRAADDFGFLNGVIPFSDQGMSIFTEFVDIGGVANSVRVSLDDGGITDRFEDIGQKPAELTSGSSNQGSINLGALPTDQVVRHAGAFSLNSIRGARDGTLGTEDTTAALPTGLTIVRLGNGPSRNRFHGLYRKVVAVPRAWNDTELQQKTAA